MEDWAARRDSRGELMVDALEMARLAADAAPGLVHDSGRGGQGSTRPGKVSATLWGTILGSGLGRVRRGSCHPRGRKANAREEASVSPSLQGCSRWWIGTVPNQGGSAFRAVHLPAGIFRSASTPAWVTYPSGEFWRTWRIGQESLTAVLSVKATKSTISFRIGR